MTTRLPQFKILLFGESNVGKTLISKRISRGDQLADFNVEVTIGVDFVEAIYDFPGDVGPVRVAYVDPPGEIQSRTIVTSYYRGCDAMIGVFDCTQKDTRTALLEDWLPTICELRPNIPVIIFANKSDKLIASYGDDRGQRKIAACVAKAERLIRERFGERIEIVDVIPTSAIDWVFPKTPSSFDLFVKLIVDRNIETRRQKLRLASGIRLFERDIDPAPQTDADDGCNGKMC